jgi:uncharacterized protein
MITKRKMDYRMKKFGKIAVWLLLMMPLLVTAQEIPKRPDPPKLVNDLADVLSPEQEAALERKLVAYDDSTSNQIVVLTVKSLDNFPIEEYSLKVLRDWGIGNQATNNGVLIVNAIDDRQVRIETGYGLEGAIPDITANQIIRNDIAPAFRSGNYYEGLNNATNSIMAAAAGEYKAPENYRDKGGSKRKFPVGLIVLLIILFLIFSNRNRGGGGGFMSRRGFRGGFAPMIFPGGGGGSWGSGGGGFGGGGFGGFGGGGGGGGGASGSW